MSLCIVQRLLIFYFDLLTEQLQNIVGMLHVQHTIIRAFHKPCYLFGKRTTAKSITEWFIQKNLYIILLGILVLIAWYLDHSSATYTR